MNEKLLDDDIKLIRSQILFGKPYGEIIKFMVSQLGLTSEEANAVYDQLIVEAHDSQKNVKYEKKR